MLHNLEHGGVMFSYKCADDSTPACKAARDKLIAIAQQIGPRVIANVPCQDLMAAPDSCPR